MLIDPLEVSAFTPAIEPMYRGIYVEAVGCSESSDYFIDVVVLKNEADEFIDLDADVVEYSSAVDLSEYGDFDNEWISLSKFYSIGATTRDGCTVNFFGDIDDLTEIPYNEYRVVVYRNDELLSVSDSYNTENISYGDTFGDMIQYVEETNEFNVEPIHSVPIPSRPGVLLLSIITILITPIVLMLFVFYIFVELIVFLIVPRFRKELRWIVLYNSILLLGGVFGVLISRIGQFEKQGITQIIFILPVLLGITFQKYRHLKNLESKVFELSIKVSAIGLGVVFSYLVLAYFVW